MLQRKTAGSRSSLTATLFLPWRFLVSLVFTPTCVWQRAHHLVFFLVLADQQLTAGSEVLYNSVHYKLDMYKHIHLQYSTTPVFEKKLTTEHKSVLCKRIFSRRYFMGDKEWRFLVLTTGGLLCTSRSFSGPVPSWTNGAVCTRVPRELERTILSTVRKVHRELSVS